MIQDHDLDWQLAAQVFKRDGMTVASRLFAEEADYIREAFIERTRAPHVDFKTATAAIDDERGLRKGVPVWRQISLTDPVVRSKVYRLFKRKGYG